MKEKNCGVYRQEEWEKNGSLSYLLAKEAEETEDLRGVPYILCVSPLSYFFIFFQSEGFLSLNTGSSSATGMVTNEVLQENNCILNLPVLICTKLQVWLGCE